MNLDRLRYFAIVAETGNLRRAAELIGMSPGALSRSLKTLESELAVRLFASDGRALGLSEAGTAIYPMAARLLAEGAAFERAVKSRVATAAPVRFCSHAVFTTYFLGYALTHGLDDVDVVAHNAPPGEIEQAVLNRRADFGLTYLPVVHDELDYLPVAQIELGLYVRRGAFRGVAPADIPSSMPIASAIQATWGNAAIDAWPAELPRQHVRYHFELLETALESCRQGLSMGCFPRFVVWLHNAQVRPAYQLVPVEAPGLVGRRLKAYLVKPKGSEESLPQRRFCRALRTVCRAAGTARGG